MIDAFRKDPLGSLLDRIRRGAAAVLLFVLLDAFGRSRSKRIRGEEQMIMTAIRAFGFFAVAACTWLVASSASAQTGCQGTNGPDVIVGDITGPANYSSTGTLEALSLGTTSCNQGTVPLGWHANTNQHPVIGGELYRWKVINGAGHFDQLGLSWLKHGFFAESQQLCCSGCQQTDGTVLGARC